MMLPPDPVYIFKGEMDSVSCVSFKMTPDVERIYAGTQTGKVHVWSLETKREIGNFEVSNDTILSINIPKEEDTIVVQNKSGGISFWKEEDHNWSLIKLIKINFFGFCKCSIFEEIIYTSLKDCKFQMISVKAKETLKTIKLTDGGNEKLGEIMAFKIKVINQQKTILVAYEAHLLILWDLEKKTKISELKLDECPMAIDFDVKTNKGICGNPSDKIVIFTFDSELKIVKTVPLVNAGVASVQIRDDGKVVAVGCWDGRLRLFSWKTLVVLAVLDTHSATIQDVSFAQECKSKAKFLLAAASQDSRISLWDLYN